MVHLDGQKQAQHRKGERENDRKHGAGVDNMNTRYWVLIAKSDIAILISLWPITVEEKSATVSELRR